MTPRDADGRQLVQRGRRTPPEDVGGEPPESRHWTGRLLFAGVVGLLAYATVVGADGGQTAQSVLLGVVALAAACFAASRGGPAALPMAAAIACYGAASVWFGSRGFSSGRIALGCGALYAGFYVLVFSALARSVRRRISGVTLALWLDCVIGGLTIAAFGAVIVSSQVDGIDGVPLWSHFVLLLADLGFLGFAGSVYLLTRRSGRTRSLLIVVAAATTIGLADGAYVIELAHGALDREPLIRISWPLALLLLAAAPLERLRGDATATTSQATILVPVAFATASLPVTFYAEPESPQDILASGALALVVGRLAFSMIENARLLAQARDAAITDALTGLANRRLLADRLDRALVRHSGREGVIALMMLDLDDFKAINDAHGHALGDAVLIEAGARICDALRDDDSVARLGGEPYRSSAGPSTVGRLGGDEFVIVLEDLHGPSDAYAVAERVLRELGEPLAIADTSLVIAASLGVTFADSTDERDAEQMLRDADIAMYEAKRSEKSGYEVFEPWMREAVITRTQLVQELHQAVPADQLRLVYQPQVDLSSGAMMAVEALVRWQHPSRGLLTPGEFIPIAETSGVIVEIDDWVLRTACMQLRRWDDRGLPPLTMAVNVSGRRLAAGGLVAAVRAAAGAADLAPERLEIEITETAAVEHPDEASSTLAALQAYGVTIAIDDFGMGHSALSRLQNFPVDRLKIDRSFVVPLTLGTENGSIAAAMVTLASSLELAVLAEGVETDEQLRALLNIGCEQGQGYLFSKPVGAADIEEMLRSRVTLGPGHPDTTAPRSRATSADVRFLRNALAELRRVTGLESTYLTEIDWERGSQLITHSDNAGTLAIEEDMRVELTESICRRALEDGVRYTDNVPATFPDAHAAAALGIQTYVGVPIEGPDGAVRGTLCGASSESHPLGESAIRVMEQFARVIAARLDEPS